MENLINPDLEREDFLAFLNYALKVFTGWSREISL